MPAHERMKRAEKKGGLSISHYKGGLHTHTKSELNDPGLPEDVAESIKGSNCGVLALESLVQYHADHMRNELLAITDHSRDGDLEAAMNGLTNWFQVLYLNNEQWLQEKFGKSQDELTADDKNEINILATKQAKKVAEYGDERIENVMEEIDELQENTPITIVKGVEANLLPDGTFDTEMIDKGKFELVNCSIHPDVDREGFKSIIKDPEKYSALVVKGMENPNVNIMCHLGFGAEQGFTDFLDWEQIAKAATENNVAIEVNLRSLMEFIYKEMLDFEKFPKNDSSYKKVFKERLDELVPILPSDKIGSILEPYFKQGLKISMNTDTHGIKYVDSKTTEAGVETDIKARDFRFWRCLKIAEQYFNELFSELGIEKNNIINTYSPEQLKDFIEK